MNKLKMKAKAGVTLIELLVVVLIVVVLSVSLLPLLQPFVTEAQYAAEPIPVIGNIRTKVGLYLYDKGHVPPSRTNGVVWAHTWKRDNNDNEKYVPAVYVVNGTVSSVALMDYSSERATHLERMIDVDYQDLKGKRSKPVHYQYYTLGTSTTNCTAYVVGCFGDGDGLKAGTGYAVCELNFPNAGKKYIGTWKCYKPAKEDAGALRFCTSVPNCRNSDNKLVACYVPVDSMYQTDLTKTTGELDTIRNMKKAGWEF